jgi:predicted metal-dependent phosphoesterase TrpH
LCAQGFALRRLLDDDARFHPDGLETFNPTTLGRPWHGRVVKFAHEFGLARVGNSDAHVASSVGAGWTTFSGHSADDLRRAIESRTTESHGTFHGSVSQLSTFGRQLRKYGRDAHATVRGRILRDGTTRDLGYPPHRVHDSANASPRESARESTRKRASVREAGR